MDDFNWVEARNDCTASSAFKALFAGVVQDLKTRLDQDGSLRQQFEIEHRSENEFFVRKQGSHEIVFERVEEAIRAVRVHLSGTERELLMVTVGMNEQGECTLKQDGRELLPWQVRRIALEETFFPKAQP